MPKIVLIHGFAVGLTSPVMRRPFGASASFLVFDNMITKKDAAVFSWGIKRQVSFWRLINPWFLFNFYEDEKFLAQACETHERLRIFLEQEQPEIIVCHSMGCFLLNNYLKKFVLPKSVHAVVFIQSDDSIFPPTKALSSSIGSELPEPIEGSESNESKSLFYNLYCPWDLTLIVSSIVNKKWRQGLDKSKQENIKNTLFPLWRPINLHTSSIRDWRLVKFVLSI